jgi:hypothetical protein
MNWEMAPHADPSRPGDAQQCPGVVGEVAAGRHAPKDTRSNPPPNRSPSRGRKWIVTGAICALFPLLGGCLGSGGGSGAPAPTATAAGKCIPRNVTNRPGLAQPSVDVTWEAPSNCSAIDHYNIVEIVSATVHRIVTSIPAAGPLEETLAVRNWCTFYSFGVEEVSSSGHQSAVAMPDQPAFTSGPALPSPPVVTIVIQGIASVGSQGNFDPSQVDYCTSPQGTMPPANDQAALQTMATRWTNWDTANDPARAYVGAGSNMIDSLASTGGYVLPFSYIGATITGSRDAPKFTAKAYNKDDVANSTIPSEVLNLNTEIIAVRSMWPNTRIIVVGHSNGGLIAEQWWLKFRPSRLRGVTQVFSLDSPLNGVAQANVCGDPIVTNGCEAFGVGQALAHYYSDLWLNQERNDPYWASEDAQDKIFTAVGTLGDPLYDVGDYRATARFGVKNIGIISQLYFPASCAQSQWDLSPQNCPYIGRAVKDNCGPLDDSTGPFFGAPADLPLHSVVKNCPGVIQAIMDYVTGAPTTATPSQSPTPTPSCTPQAFLKVVKGSGPTQPTISGPPICVDGYALQLFTAGPAGQAAQFFFKKAQNGSWTLIEGGNAIPTIACRVIPASVLTKLGAQCPPAAYASSPSTSTTSKCSSAVFLKLMLTQGATFTGASGPPTCLDGYAEQNFTFPKGPTSNYPTYFFKSDGGGGWTVLGGGAIGDVTSVCSSLPANVRTAFALPATADSGCPAG